MDLIYRQSDGFECSLGEFDSGEERIYFSLDERLDDVKDFLRIVKESVDTLDFPYLKMQETLSLSGSEIFRALPAQKRNAMCERVYQALKKSLAVKENEVYLSSYIEQKNFLRSLKMPVFCPEKTKVLCSKIDHENTRKRVASIDKADQKTQYSMSGTVTGRLVVTKGPNILTLPSSVRGCIKSMYSSGKILQIDLTAAEPFLALLRAGKEPPEDIYSHVADHVLEGKVSRSEAKLVTLSALYGQSSSNLSKKLPESINARDVISRTKEYFESKRLASELSHANRSGNFRNILGRPIFLEDARDSLLISYYLQSSIAECSILLFSDFYKKFRSVMKPYYVIHDALIFDAEEEFSRRLLQKESITLSLGTWKFKAKVSEV
jgi:hypothetical protein